jgi:hypothetical protein
LQASAVSRADELSAGRKKLAADAEKQRQEISSLEEEIAELNAKLEALDEQSGVGKVRLKPTFSAALAAFVHYALNPFPPLSSPPPPPPPPPPPSHTTATTSPTLPRVRYNFVKGAAAKGKKGKGGEAAAGGSVSLDSADRAEYNKLKATGAYTAPVALSFSF